MKKHFFDVAAAAVAAELLVLMTVIDGHQGVVFVAQAVADETSDETLGDVHPVFKVKLYRPPRVGDKARVDELEVDGAVDAYPIAGVQEPCHGGLVSQDVVVH